MVAKKGIQDMAKLIKVTLEYDNAISTLTDRAQEWLNEVNGYIAIQSLRTSTPGMSHYDWKIKKKKKLASTKK
mgnify:CR=1 FL=1